MKLSEHVRSTHSQDGAVVLDIREGQMFRLNLVGSRILELVCVGFTESQITDVISREFLANRSTVERDVQDFLRHLKTHGLIEIRETGSPTAS
jgi:hypothetical protein